MIRSTGTPDVSFFPRRPRFRDAVRRLAPAGAICLLGFVIAGCRTARESVAEAITPDHQPVNHARYPVASDTLRPGARIAVLPVYHPDLPDAELSRFDRTLFRNFAAVYHYEWVPVTREDLRSWTGHTQLSPVQPVPPELFAALAENLGAQAVLFTDLTRFQPYKPIDIGIRSRLTVLDDLDTAWAADHLYDAGEPRVAVAARRFARNRQAHGFPLQPDESILISPNRFFDYVAWSTASSLAGDPD